MPINFSHLRSLTARVLIRTLRRDGFVLDRQRGTHQQYLHEDGRRVTVSYHRSGDTFKLGTLRSMIEQQAKWTEEDLIRLKLIKRKK